ncbi:Protein CHLORORESPIRATORY REDUCTION 7, chloroplastic [Zea mays]|uniref:Protein CHLORORESPIRATORY REDUCTION 7, chloroplastic n=1 Tax=Zea mays TaxID=4577 RepID=A0A3L6FNC1_MAIZE|nr:Protein CHLORORESPIRATORY REDUCTION 7, chloroplastic [Zea mays]
MEAVAAAASLPECGSTGGLLISGKHEGDVRADGTRHGRGVRVQRGARGEPHKNWPVDTLSLDLARFGMVDEAVSYLVRSVCVLEIDGDVGSVEWYQVQLD